MRRFGRGFRASVLVPSVVAAAVLATATLVRAADMAVPPAYNPPVMLPPAHYDWTGLYVGGNVGVGLLMDSVTGAPPIGATPLASGTTLGPVGLIGGAQAGLNIQFAPVVIGGEVSWTSSNINGSSNANTTVAAPPTERFISNPLWIATATGRAGYAANDWLFYAKGGGAVMRVGYEEDSLTGGIAGPNQSVGANRKGFTVGGGVEYGLTENWSAKLEYDFFDFGTQTVNYNLTPVAINSRLEELTFGINYRFNWPGGWH
jgi:outer membrane immunogenic protein